MISKTLAGRYQILEQVGVGGMATVYKARDTKEDKIVAVKVLDNKHVNDTQKINIFFREVDVMSRMKHDNCVRIFDHGVVSGEYFIVMEYVDGLTLHQIIGQGGKLSPAKAVKYAIQILAALDEAHRNGIVHRDIKPQNIKVDKTGNIKVLDFGIARLIDGGNSIIDGNTVLGSVHYVSPEQAMGTEVDNRSDLYSMGVVLYEMLTGKPPFDNPNPMSIVAMHCRRMPDPMVTVNRNISASLDEVVLKALSKDRKDRYKSAAEMARDLKRALRHPEGGIVSSETRFDRFKEYVRANMSNMVLITLSMLTIIIILGYGCGKVVDIMFKVDVPNVNGELLDDALAILKGSNLDAVIQEVYTNESSAGRVILQEPVSGTRVNKNRDIKLTVSVGEEPVALPDVVGMESAAALQLFAEYGFPEVSIEYDWNDEVALDTVLKQEPESGFVSPSSRITLTLNSAYINLPVLCGRPVRQALDLLESLNLNAQVIAAYSADEPADTVILQNPAPGAQLMRGTTVTMAVSLSMENIYYCTYNIRVPLTMDVKAVLKTPSGLETVAYDARADMDEVITLKLTSAEQGEHTLTVMFDGKTTITETLVFE